MIDRTEKIGMFSVDPAWASPAGWALWLPGGGGSRAGFLRYGQLAPRKKKAKESKEWWEGYLREWWKGQIDIFMDSVKKKGKEYGVKRILFIAETQFLANNIRVAMLLSEARTMWESIAWMKNDMDLVFEIKPPVHPHVWQSAVIGKTGRMKGENYRDWLKEQARWLAVGELSDHGVNIPIEYDKKGNLKFEEHMADAICLNRYGRGIYVDGNQTPF